jgi:putative oxidoreductase
MATAIVFAHLKNGLFGKDGGFEYPLTMLATVLFVAMHGPGKWSVDSWRAQRREG